MLRLHVVLSFSPSRALGANEEQRRVCLSGLCLEWKCVLFNCVGISEGLCSLPSQWRVSSLNCGWNNASPPISCPYMKLILILSAGYFLFPVQDFKSLFRSLVRGLISSVCQSDPSCSSVRVYLSSQTVDWFDHRKKTNCSLSHHWFACFF